MTMSFLILSETASLLMTVNGIIIDFRHDTALNIADALDFRRIFTEYL